MKNLERSLRIVGILLGLASAAFFVADTFIFTKLQPKMVRFTAISPAEEGLFIWVGIGLLVFFAFCLLSLFQLSAFLKNAQRVSLFSYFLIGSGVLSLLFVFGDVALLSDIGKQYRFGLDQPEWLMLYSLIGFQFITTVVFTYLHFFGFSKEKQINNIVRDSNIFVVVQYVGAICGVMGLTSSGLRFLFPGATIKEHILMNLIILLPYVLAVGYWVITKLQEENRQWVDEKQMQDIGRSAFLTLAASAIFMVLVFALNYSHLDGVVSLLWFPLYLFSALLVFSAGNLYFTAKS